METPDLLTRTSEIARRYIESLPDRPVHASADVAKLRRAFVRPLPEHGETPIDVI